MAHFKKVLRVAGWIALVPLALLVCLGILVPIQQRVFRWRAERLLADMQSIELYKTPWSQVQVLMQRWGAWGHYDGTCTWTNCKYTIALSDLSGYASRPGNPSWFTRNTWPFFLSPVYRWLGGRIGTFEVGFVVQDGTIWRAYQSTEIDVPAGAGGDRYELEYGNMVHVQSRSSLNIDADPRSSHWILGNNAQLADHPYFKAGRPSGCENCMAIDVTYSTASPKEEIRRLTTFDLSCITRRTPCLFPEQILPAARPWHLYIPHDLPRVDLPEPPRSCNVPLFALGRDAISVFSVDALSVSIKKRAYDDDRPPYESVKARLVETLKGSAPWPVGTVLDAYPYAKQFNDPDADPAEHMTPGKRYLALVEYPFQDDRYPDQRQPPPGTVNGVPGIDLDRCGVLDDTPQNRAELARGFAQNDSLRVPDF